MTCSKCLEGRHIRCADPISCTCGLCTLRRNGGIFAPDPARVGKPAAIRKRRKHSTSGTPRPAISSNRTNNKQKYGIYTDFSDEDVQYIFSRKAQGASINGLAKALGVSRDRVRTVYHAPTAPEVEVHERRNPAMRSSADTHLDKAKGALNHAKELCDGLAEGEDIYDNPALYKRYLGLIDLASVQASLAQAEALNRIANEMEAR